MFKRTMLLFLFLFLLPITASAIDIGDTIPSFSGTDMDGNPVNMDMIIGKQPAMLTFWASWCPNCKTEVPKTNALYKKYGPQGMYFIGINVGFNDSPERARAFMKSSNMTQPVLFDKEGSIAIQYQVRGVPTVIVIDKKGKVVFKNFGVPEITDELFKQINQ
jgi:peroxiredoxin